MLETAWKVSQLEKKPFQQSHLTTTKQKVEDADPQNQEELRDHRISQPLCLVSIWCNQVIILWLSML